MTVAPIGSKRLTAALEETAVIFFLLESFVSLIIETITEQNRRSSSNVMYIDIPPLSLKGRQKDNLHFP